ncbi:hypothetical protein E2C01_067964 [Portunus trituberculatus]|uniref:Uncharacterized protein n=1 Tax=Portunus trituberculatus TaxID=210409 RepID=A0A5B7HV49_PORTR|nr:hypothetical protein [Portunus trituberculatus]
MAEWRLQGRSDWCGAALSVVVAGQGVADRSVNTCTVSAGVLSDAALCSRDEVKKWWCLCCGDEATLPMRQEVVNVCTS